MSHQDTEIKAHIMKIFFSICIVKFKIQSNEYKSGFTQ